jgi:hypothetical protein
VRPCRNGPPLCRPAFCAGAERGLAVDRCRRSGCRPAAAHCGSRLP